MKEHRKMCLILAACLWLLNVPAMLAESFARWRVDDSTQQNVHMIIDADIQAPTLAEVPVYEVKRTIVSEEQLMRIAECCMPGRKLFAADSSRNPLSP
ncbi:MAG TPA: hypothetical protein PK321_11330, partial [Clostridia bacterium]|nr:hypothetical protein [Clostridia bacterium]